MNSIGVRELRQRASEYLRRVEAGETIEVTDRGRPIALLSPIPQSSTLDRLRAEGQVEPATTDEFPQPLPRANEHDSPSDTLAQMREDER